MNSPNIPTLSHSQYRQFYAQLLKARRHPLLIISLEFILTVTLTFFLIWFAIRPTILTISELVRQIEDVQDVNQKLDSKIKNLAQAEINLSESSQSLELLNQAVPSSPLLTETFSLLQLLIQQHGVTLNEISGPSISFPLPSQPEVKSYQYKLSVFGDYSNLKALAHDLESQLRFNHISALSFVEADNKDQSASGLAAEIKVIFYSYEPNK